VLRYWFRAIALGLYSPQVCQQWEGELFGDLGQQGRITIGAPSKLKSNQDVYCYEGTLLLEAQDTEALQLAEAILKVAYGLGGLGRGCRRPLHRVNQRMRGCHWELNDISMPFEPSVWTDLIDAARQVCRALKPSSQEYTCPPGRPRERRQDVLDRHAMVWLVESSDMLRFDPAQVNWAKDGHQESVRGCALTLLYSSDQFKGKSTDQPGNPCVGGAMPGGGIGTPSYVWIRSMFPANQQPYQVVTIFGANHPDRQAFAQAIQNTGGVLAWGNAIG
jgi:CRISPR-associated protein Cmr6